jgi:hypothetical protein
MSYDIIPPETVVRVLVGDETSRLVCIRGFQFPTNRREYTLRWERRRSITDAWHPVGSGKQSTFLVQDAARELAAFLNEDLAAPSPGEPRGPA